MPMYRKKPVVVEARRFDDPDDRAGLATWCGGTFLLTVPFGARHKPVIEITTLEGVMTADLGDWVIRGVKGEFYPIKDPIFRETYELVEDAP